MNKQLKLLMLLSGNRWYSRQELMDIFEVSERTIYRDLDQLKRAGFLMDNEGDRYRLVLDHAQTKDLKKLIHFDEQEVAFFYKALMELKGSEIFAKELIRKLHSLYDFKVLKENSEKNIIGIIHQLSNAIADKRQVLLKDYRSSNSEVISDRLVEPFDFGKEYQSVICLDKKDKKVKHFKIARIAKVEVCDNHWFEEELHRKPFTDAFRLSADKSVDNVELLLSLTAYNLMKEEFPLTIEHIQKLEDDSYHLSINIANYKGIGRFVLGLPGEIKILGSEQFRKYISEAININNY